MQIYTRYAMKEDPIDLQSIIDKLDSLADYICSIDDKIRIERESRKSSILHLKQELIMFKKEMGLK